jgi:hypothetical protein
MVHFGHHFPGKIVQSIVFYSTSVPSGNSSGSSADSADSADSGETVSGTTDQTLPFTGRSFRMTGVLNKLPQTTGMAPVVFFNFLAHVFFIQKSIWPKIFLSVLTIF